VSTPSTPARSTKLATPVLATTSIALIALSIYQWLELIEVRGGKTPACAVNETINCATVWNSPFAHTVQEWFGFPVAGLGVWWGVVALALTFVRAQRESAGGDTVTFTAAVKFWALAGLLSCVTFVTASLQAKALCLTCVGTYALTVGYAVGALKMLGGPAVPPNKELAPGIGWALVLMAPVYLGLLYPGSKTPQGAQAVVKQLQQASNDPTGVTQVFESLPLREQQMTSWAREEWKKSEPKDTSAFATHARKGSADARVRIVEFTDILCGHCAQFEMLMHEIERMAASTPNALSVEPRYYPLDSECNPDIKGSAKDGVRCYGARLQICSESSPNFFKMRSELFENQQQLNQGMMLAIAQRHGLDIPTLQECMKSPATQARLTEDIAYAKLFNIEGTPLVLLNGKVAPPAPAFLLGMVASGANVDAPWFLKLPPAPANLE